jgi:hypothetical protein
MICDYYIVRKGYLDINTLYSGRKTDPYYYTLGFSWRAYVAYIAGIIINIVGFASAVGRQVPVGAQYIYNINYWRRGGLEDQCPRNKDMVLNREEVMKGRRLRETSPPPIKARYTERYSYFRKAVVKRCPCHSDHDRITGAASKFGDYIARLSRKLAHW